MSQKHWVDDNTYRVVSDDGSKSYLYEADKGILPGPDRCTEVAHHYEDGTTDAWEYKPSIFGDGRGSKKNDD